jgi:hypothetical protein
MELTEPNDFSHHASVSLKVVLLIFALVLIGALGYLVWAQNSAPDTTDYSSPVVKKTSAPADENAVACGDKAYAFSLTFDAKWQGYKIKEVKPDYALVTCYINMPTTDTDPVWTTESVTNFPKYASVFAVSVYTPSQWAADQQEPQINTFGATARLKLCLRIFKTAKFPLKLKLWLRLSRSSSCFSDFYL